MGSSELRVLILFIGLTTVTTIVKGETNQTEHVQVNIIKRPEVSTLENFARNAVEESKNATEKSNQTEIMVNITSPNYPDPYPANTVKKWIIQAIGGGGIEIMINELDLGKEDYIRIVMGADSSKEGLILTGQLKKPLMMKTFQTKTVLIEFVSMSKENTESKGFWLSYQTFGDPPVVTTEGPQPTIPTSKLQTITKLISVPNVQQINETWTKFKDILCVATNNFTKSRNMSLEKCQRENVTFTSIFDCPSDWKGHKDCLRLTFAITLSDLENEENDDVESSQDRELPTELSKANLEDMWSRFGKESLKNAGYPEFEIPKAGPVLALWISVSLGILILFLLILWGIWRMDVLHSYIPWNSHEEDKHTILKNATDFDITMFPSPHQIVPTLFPANSNAFSNGAANGYETRPRMPIGESNETESKSLRGNSSVRHAGPNDSFVDDLDDKRIQFRTFVKGAIKDESIS